MKKNKLWALSMAIVMSMMICFPAFAEEANQEEYPLAGILEIVEETGIEFGSNRVITARVLRRDGIYERINNFSGGDAAVLRSLAEPVEFTGYNAEAQTALRTEVLRFMNSFDWKNASEYERAERAAVWMAENHTPEFDENGWQVNRTDFEGAYPILGAKKGGLCRNYCSAYQLLCRAVGLNCLTYSNYEATHGWNNVQIDGTWRKIDMFSLTGYDSSEKIKQSLDTPTDDDLTKFGEAFQ